jgi:hypothetical protein
MVEAKKYRVVEEISAHGKREFFPERKVLGMWWRYGVPNHGNKIVMMWLLQRKYIMLEWMVMNNA